MAGKSVTQCGMPLAFALELLSKNAIIDLVLDLAHASLGETMRLMAKAYDADQRLRDVVLASRPGREARRG